MPFCTSLSSSCGGFILFVHLEHVPLCLLSCCLYFMFLVGWLCVPALEKWSSVGDLLMSQQRTPLSSPRLYALMAPCCVGPSVVLSKLCGLSGRLYWSPVQLVNKSCLVWSLPTIGWWVQIMRWLPAKHQWAPELALVQWWVDSGSKRPQGCCPSTCG